MRRIVRRHIASTQAHVARVLTGRILKLVQSPIYSGASQVNSLRDALVRLGLKTLRDVVMQIAMNMKVFRSDDYADTMELIRRHSTMTAHLVMGKHHQVLMDGTPHPLAATICLADDLAHEYGFGVIPKADGQVEAMTELERDCVRSHTSVDRSTPKTLEHAKRALGIDDQQMELIRSDAIDVIEKFG